MLAKLRPVMVMVLLINRPPAPADRVHHLSRFHLLSLDRSAGGKPEPKARPEHASVAYCDALAIARRPKRLIIALSADPLWRSLIHLHLSAVVRTGHRVLMLEGHRTSLVVVIDRFARDLPKVLITHDPRPQSVPDGAYSEL